jgi:spore coat assembly protein SafA
MMEHYVLFAHNMQYPVCRFSREGISMDYIVQPGDTMFLIAQNFGIALNTLIAANPQMEDPNLIYPGQLIDVPVNPYSSGR